MRSGIYRALIVLGLLFSACATACGTMRTTGNGGTKVESDRAPAAGNQAARPALPPSQRRIDCAKVKCVALTFDDGPSLHTPKLLDTLRRSDTRVTFFVLGQNVERHGATVRRMVHEGHEVGNHSWDHPIMPSLSPRAMRRQIQLTQQAVRQASGVTPKVFRPPYGATDERVARAAGMPQITWSVDCMDWHRTKARKGIATGMKEARPGGIILLHDTHGSTVRAVPKMLSTLKGRGFTLVTVSELFQGKRFEAQATYTNLE